MKRRRCRRGLLALLLTSACLALAPAAAFAEVSTTGSATPPASTSGENGGTSLEAAAAKAGNTGRAVAMSLIGLAFAVAATVLAFRRDFKEAAGVFAVGIVSVLLATPAGVSLLRDTVASLFGTQ
jgi:ABC-type transport system substrate-binding protein